MVLGVAHCEGGARVLAALQVRGLYFLMELGANIGTALWLYGTFQVRDQIMVALDELTKKIAKSIIEHSRVTVHFFGQCREVLLHDHHRISILGLI